MPCDLILKAYRAEPLGGGSFGPGSAGVPPAVSGVAPETSTPGAAALQRRHDAAREENESSARTRTTARGTRALPTEHFFHGKSGNRLVVVGPINLPVGRVFVEEVITECRKRGAARVDVLAFEFEMGPFPAVLEEARLKGIDLAPKTIPPEVFDKRAVDKGEVRFHGVAYIEVTPRFGLGSAGVPPAVSGVAPETSSSGAAALQRKNDAAREENESSARTRTTARGTRALPNNNLTLAVGLTDFSVYYSQGVVDAITADLKKGKSEVVCEAGGAMWEALRHDARLPDANAWLRLILCPEELGAAARGILNQPDVLPFGLPVISVREAKLKARKGGPERLPSTDAWLASAHRSCDAGLKRRPGGFITSPTDHHPTTV